MKIFRRKKTPVTASYRSGLVSIWWYTDDGEFWEFSKTLDEAEDDHGFLQYSLTKNHLTLWREAVKSHVSDPKERKSVIDRGYKSIERGRVVFNIRTQSYEVTCSDALINDPEFRSKCIDAFRLSGNRYDFVAMHHYGKQELTGNPALDSMYYET